MNAEELLILKIATQWITSASYAAIFVFILDIYIFDCPKMNKLIDVNYH